jgi:hypothetical protein
LFRACERGCCSAACGVDQLICGVGESATGRVAEKNPVGVDLARGDPRRRGSAFPVVDGPLGVDQPPAVVFASQTRSQHLPPSRAETRATGTRVTVPGICSSNRNKPTSPAMRDNLWISRADGSLPPHVHKDVGAARRSADSTSIRKLGDSAGTDLVISTSAERQRSFPPCQFTGSRDDQGNRRRTRPTFQSGFLTARESSGVPRKWMLLAPACRALSTPARDTPRGRAVLRSRDLCEMITRLPTAAGIVAGQYPSHRANASALDNRDG